MKSPFPGMDPYLELHWRDVHASLVLYTRNQLQPQLGGGLKARVEERVVLEAFSASEERDVYPDVRVVTRPSDRPNSTVSGPGTVAPPVMIERLSETHTEGFVQVFDTRDNDRVVSVIEVLSPTNKRPGRDRNAYVKKQSELVEGRVNLIEIDLLRGGVHTLQVPERDIPPAARSVYAACVQRASRPGNFEFYPMPLRERLPAIAVPLREEDEDVRLDIQALVDQAHADGGYDADDYDFDLKPPASDEDAAWIAEQLRRAGLR